MAGPIVGSIEHFLGSGFGTGSAQSIFVSLYRFLVNASSSLGVTRLAYNTGSTGTGMTAGATRGMGMFDEAQPAGENAFAVFRFNNASLPFDVLIQWTGVTTFGTAPGSPGLVIAGGGGGSTTNVVGIAFAQRLDGATAWGGSTLNNGNDTKSTPVWNTGSNVPTLFVPRSNDPVRIGAHGASKQNMVEIVHGINNAAYRASFVADYDNFASVVDVSNDNTYQTTWFGKYVPITGSTAEIPYFGFLEGNAGSGLVVGTLYGTIAGNTFREGGIMFPSASLSGTIGIGFDRLGTTFFQNADAQPNKAFVTPTWNEFPINVGILESSTLTGFMGQTDSFIREIYNAATHDTNGDGTRCVFGGATQASVKFTIPWHSGTTPGVGISRGGVQFSNP